MQPGKTRAANAKNIMTPEHENDGENLFSLCADVCGESAEIVSTEKLPGTCPELRPLLVQEPIRW
jgi:hypothetical protein